MEAPGRENGHWDGREGARTRTTCCHGPSTDIRLAEGAVRRKVCQDQYAPRVGKKLKPPSWKLSREQLELRATRNRSMTGT